MWLARLSIFLELILCGYSFRGNAPIASFDAHIREKRHLGNRHPVPVNQVKPLGRIPPRPGSRLKPILLHPQGHRNARPPATHVLFSNPLEAKKMNGVMVNRPRSVTQLPVTKASSASGPVGSLTCMTVKCAGGHRCIMTKFECNSTGYGRGYTPANCEPHPKCVPDKTCPACGLNQRRSRCSKCERTCDDPQKFKCKESQEVCGLKSRCVCEEPYVRTPNGQCVLYKDCPNLPPTPDGWIVVKGKSRNESHERIDLLKPTTTGKLENEGLIIVKEKQTNQHDKPQKPDDGLIIIKEKQIKHNNQPKEPSTKHTKPAKPEDGLIVVKEKKHSQKKHPGNKNEASKKPDSSNDFMVVKKKVQIGSFVRTNL